ncbi:unnamed protein product [Rhodiola kirilowii]
MTTATIFDRIRLLVTKFGELPISQFLCMAGCAGFGIEFPFIIRDMKAIEKKILKAMEEDEALYGHNSK